MQSQYEEKKRMGYSLRAESHMCVDCIAYTSTIIERSDAYGMPYQSESEMLCAIGGFAIKKNATCGHWSPRLKQALLDTELSAGDRRPPIGANDGEARYPCRNSGGMP